ncbi:hypothetical protein LCGC14_1215920 [marine sediment metagenome]|uniref:Uncharacterized protein n=1 Tax=marine sediment metagenome TaxID=412755 RepID=A0A0F9LGU4_9ZZZZ
MNTQERISNYVRLRDFKKNADLEFKKSMARVNDAMKKLEGQLMKDIEASGGDSLSGERGTVYTTVKSNASIKDRDAFLRFVFQTKNLEVLDVRANKAIVRELSKAGTVVPGVNYTEVKIIGVRKGK